MTIPEVTKRLREIAEELSHAELAQLADELPRRAPVRRAPTTSRKVDAQMRVDVHTYAESHPGESYVSIARRFDINPGRVSEIMAGYRE